MESMQQQLLAKGWGYAILSPNSSSGEGGAVYTLLGKQGLGTQEFPPIETSLLAGDVAFRQHSGGHTDGPNWPFFLTFADRYLHARAHPSTPQTGDGK